jgi:PAS domain-containing protein
MEKPDASSETPSSEAILLQWLEGPFRLLAEHLPERILFKDRESRFLWVNRVALKVLGAAALSEILGKTDRDYFDAAHADKARAEEIQVMESGQPLIDLVGRRTCTSP